MMIPLTPVARAPPAGIRWLEPVPLTFHQPGVDQMINRNDLFPSRYLNANNLPRPSGVYVIAAVEEARIGTPPKLKLVIYFRGLSAGLPLNKINFDVLYDAFGADEEQWSGRSVVLRKEKASVGGRSTDAVRVHLPPAGAEARPAPEPDESEVPLPNDPDWETADAE